MSNTYLYISILKDSKLVEQEQSGENKSIVVKRLISMFAGASDRETVWPPKSQ